MGKGGECTCEQKDDQRVCDPYWMNSGVGERLLCDQERLPREQRPRREIGLRDQRGQ